MPACHAGDRRFESGRARHRPAPVPPLQARDSASLGHHIVVARCGRRASPSRLTTTRISPTNPAGPGPPRAHRSPWLCSAWFPRPATGGCVHNDRARLTGVVGAQVRIIAGAREGEGETVAGPGCRSRRHRPWPWRCGQPRRRWSMSRCRRGRWSACGSKLKFTMVIVCVSVARTVTAIQVYAASRAEFEESDDDAYDATRVGLDH